MAGESGAVVIDIGAARAHHDVESLAVAIWVRWILSEYDPRATEVWIDAADVTLTLGVSLPRVAALMSGLRGADLAARLGVDAVALVDDGPEGPAIVLSTIPRVPPTGKAGRPR